MARVFVSEYEWDDNIYVHKIRQSVIYHCKTQHLFTESSAAAAHRYLRTSCDQSMTSRSSESVDTTNVMLAVRGGWEEGGTNMSEREYEFYVTACNRSSKPDV